MRNTAGPHFNLWRVVTVVYNLHFTFFQHFAKISSKILLFMLKVWGFDK